MKKTQINKSSNKRETPNIFKKMFFSFVIVPIIPVIALLYLTFSAQQERTEFVRYSLVGSATLIAENINEWIGKHVYISELMSQLPDIKSMDPIRQKTILKKIKEQSDTVTAVRIDNNHGFAVARSDNKKLKDYSDRQYFQQVLKGADIGQQVIFGKTQKKPLLCFTVPIKEDQELLGTLNQCSTLVSISLNVTDLKIGNTGFAFLVDQDNRLIAYGGTNKKLVGQLEDMSNHPALKINEKEDTFVYQDNDRKVIAHKQGVGLGWTLVVQQDYSEAYVTPISARNNAIIAVLLTTIVCLLIVYFMSRSISRPLQEARQETDDILGAASDGLFLMNKDYIIGNQQSANLSMILQKENLSGKSFLRYLNEAVPIDVSQMARDYIDLLFTVRVKEELVQTRNPLLSVQTSIQNKKGELESKYLSLTFKRVYNQGEIDNLLVTVKDITKETLLQKELERVKEDKDEQVSLLKDILYIPSDDLAKFLDVARETLGKVNTILERPGSSKNIYQAKLDSIFQLIHKVKGDASSIKFGLFAKSCHEFEEILNSMQASSTTLSGNEFLPVALALEELFRKCNMVDELFQKIDALVANSDVLESAGEAVPEHLENWQPLQTLAHRLAEKHKKQVEVHFKGFKTALPKKYQSALKDIATQFVRNSIVHGIEPSTLRQQQSKIEDGQITMSIKHSYERGYIFTYMDDGQGINFHKIRDRIVRKGIATAEEAEKYSEAKLLRVIFKSGFSIKDSADIDAGRGVGLSLVMSRVKQLQGKIKVTSVFGKCCKFKIILPNDPTRTC